MTQFKPHKRRKNDRQYIWEYMRRNRVFKIEDLLCIVEEMSMVQMQVFFRQLEHAGYVKMRKPQGKETRTYLFRERSYGLVKNTGILCPVWLRKEKRLFDRNTHEARVRECVMRLPVEVKKKSPLKPVDPSVYAKGRVEQILKSEPNLDDETLQHRSGLSGESFRRVIEELGIRN